MRWPNISGTRREQCWRCMRTCSARGSAAIICADSLQRSSSASTGIVWKSPSSARSGDLWGTLSEESAGETKQALSRDFEKRPDQERRRWDLNPRRRKPLSTLAGWCTRPDYATSPRLASIAAADGSPPRPSRPSARSARGRITRLVTPDCGAATCADRLSKPFPPCSNQVVRPRLPPAQKHFGQPRVARHEVSLVDRSGRLLVRLGGPPDCKWVCRAGGPPLFLDGAVSTALPPPRCTPQHRLVRVELRRWDARATGCRGRCRRCRTAAPRFDPVHRSAVRPSRCSAWRSVKASRSSSTTIRRHP